MDNLRNVTRPGDGQKSGSRSLDGFVRQPAIAKTRTSPMATSPSLVATKEATQKKNANSSKQSARSSDTLETVMPKSLSLPAYEAPRRPLRPVNKRRVRMWALRFASIFIAIFLATGGFLFWRGYMQLHKVFRGTGTVAALDKNVNPNLLKGEGSGRVNILLLGIGGVGHDGPDLTDTMLVLSIDPVNDTAALLSVPRDLWVKQPVDYFGNYQKINAVYESAKYKTIGGLDASNKNTKAIEAGFKADDQILETVLGIKMNYHVLVDFQAFRQAINTVGGVNVDVKTQLYDPTMAWENNWDPVLAKVGWQVMQGKQALLYARSRETTSDFARTRRQRQIIVALKDKVFSMGTLSNPAKLSELMNAFGNNVYSDLSLKSVERLYSIMHKISNSKIQSIGLADPPNNFVTTDHVGNISVVRPIAGFNNYTAIKKYVRTVLPDGYLVKEHAQVLVVGSTSAEAAAKAALLKTYGYDAVASSTTYQGGTGHPVLVNLADGKDKYTKHYLEQHFSTTAIDSLPSDLNLEVGSAKFVIILS